MSTFTTDAPTRESQELQLVASRCYQPACLTIQPTGLEHGLEQEFDRMNSVRFDRMNSVKPVSPANSWLGRQPSTLGVGS